MSGDATAILEGGALDTDQDAPQTIGQAPFYPARFPVTRRTSRRAEVTGWRRVADDVQWYGTKWLRQMLFVALHPEDGFWELKRGGDWWSVAFMLSLLIAARGAVMGFMGFHYVFFAIDQTQWSAERAFDLITRTLTFGLTSYLYGGNPEDTSILQEGVRIVIDDFGTSQSSLSALRHMPITALKVDNSFVDSLGKAFEERDIVVDAAGGMLRGGLHDSLQCCMLP